jgi:uncharacterized protein YacL
LLDWIVVRIVLLIFLVAASYYYQPFGISGWYDSLLGLGLGLAILIFETRVSGASLKRLLGAAVGSVLGLTGAYLVCLILGQSTLPRNTVSFLQMFAMVVMTYIGLMAGAQKGDMLNLAALGGLFGTEKPSKRLHKILDTSVIIDGRIADICAAGFLDGVLVAPQFVLRELQQIADSGDAMKRNRGRRGLDILQKMQNLTSVTVQIVDDDFPAVREVDLKLIELAKSYEAKIVTNDFNLNKVAQLHGVEVLNINELANALKPVVLPGEIMRVFILKEGKEYNQGVAYLDDGTMVVVDNARKMISKTIDVSVTSVLQTTAGKMIFGKYDDRHPVRERTEQPVSP